MPWTLYRYIFKEVFKLLAVTTTVLVLVISFAAAIKPLNEGLLGPAALLKYVFYLAPTMLGFTLPFAGAFAGALVFGRMANDRELVACRAGGIGYGSILLPVVFLGLVLMLGLFFLSNWVVPGFYQRAAAMLETDLTRLLVGRIEQQQPVTLGGMVLYADAVDDTQAPPVLPDSAVQPSKLIRLQGVVAGQLDEAGRLLNDATARHADLLLFHVDGDAWVTMSLQQVTYHDAARGDLFWVEQWSVPQIRVPSPFRDSPRFMSWPQLRRLGRRPERFDLVRITRRELVNAIAEEQVLQLIEAGLAGGRGRSSVTLPGVGPGRSYQVSAPVVRRLEDGLELLADAAVPVRVDYIEGGLVVRRIEAAGAVVQAQTMDPQPEPQVLIELSAARMIDARVGARRGAEHATLALPRARWPKPVVTPLTSVPINDLIGLAKGQYADSAAVQHGVYVLRYHINRLFRGVVAQLHERAAQAVACLLVLLFSAVLSMRMTGSIPLVTYFWSFLPAVIVVVITHSGENIATDPSVPSWIGQSVMWLGDLLLAATTGVMYWVLARN